ncbi:MAG TPA: efflux RND transporter periplasmic adaptor subunit [Fimbriimonas sp.]|nr:efflux RND transporter periplasmic adaptor subunit [Fimbriimonas sp.]
MAETKGVERPTEQANGGQGDGGQPKQREFPAQAPAGPAPAEKKKAKPVIWIVLGVLVILGLFYGVRFYIWNQSHTSTDDAYVTGDLVNVSPQISGTLQSLYVEEGQFVHRGQLIAKLDPSAAQSTLNQAMANYQAALSQVPAAEKNFAYEQQQTAAAIQRAQAALQSQQAKTSGARAQVALTSATVKHQIDQAQAQIQAANAQWQQSQAQVGSAGASKENYVQAVQTAQAGYANSQQQIVTAQKALGAATSRVAAAQSVAANAAQNEKRYRTLYDQDAISAQAYDQAREQAQNSAAQLQAAQSEAQQAESQVESAKRASAQSRSMVEQARKNVNQADAQVKAARKAADAYHEQVRVAQAGLGIALANTNQIGVQQSNLSSTASQTGEAQADIQTARAGQEQVEARHQQVKVSQAQADQAKAAVRNAQITLANTYIYAPCDGEVVRKDSNEGATMAPGTTIVTLTRGASVWVMANFKETQLEGVHAGESAEIEVDALGGKVFKGQVEAVTSATGAATALLPPDNATGNFTKVVQRIPVRIRFLAAGPGDDKKYATADDIRNLRQGMSVTATIDTKSDGSAAEAHAPGSARVGQNSSVPNGGEAPPSTGGGVEPPAPQPPTSANGTGNTVQPSSGPASHATGMAPPPEQSSQMPPTQTGTLGAGQPGAIPSTPSQPPQLATTGNPQQSPSNSQGSTAPMPSPAPGSGATAAPGGNTGSAAGAGGGH